MIADLAAAIERARVARAAGRLQAAMAEYTGVVERAKAEDLTTELVVALGGIGQIERDLGRPEAASSNYREAVEVCRRANEPIRLAHALRHVADIDRELGRNEAAAGSASEAIEIYRQHHVSSLELANALRVWALVQDACGRLAGATRAWQEARNLFEAEGIEDGVTECETQLARRRRSK